MANKLRIITSVTALVRALGGTKAVAAWADVGMPAVSNWLADGYIPPGWHYRLHIECERRGYHVDPKVFGVGERIAARRVA